MAIHAVLDATEITAPDGPATLVAGLTLLERNIRLASVCGASSIWVRLPAEADEPQISSAFSADGPIRFFRPGEPLPEISPEIKKILLLDGSTVFQRSLIKNALQEAREIPPEGVGHSSRRFALFSNSRNASELLQNPATALQQAPPGPFQGWVEPLSSPESVARAEDLLFQGCRKAQDGIVSRYLNRNLSISLSRRLASTWVTPNHISFLTFTLGFAAALAAAWGDYTGFLLAGFLYQLNSVIDGVDGELARVRYEFSLLGEWLDTISDDLADFLLYIGLGVGAWRTLETSIGPFGSEIWLYLGLLAAFGKLASVIVYYRWLIAHGRGDLLAFQWSFKDEELGKKSALAQALSFTHYFFRKDFIVFAAFFLAILGFLPHLLFALAPGNLIVAISVVIQQLRSK